MPSDLTPAEKEENEAERLIGKKPAPSRKRAPRRAPKYDNRRRRMNVEDPDLKAPVEGDRDLSLNRKGSLRRMAFLVLAKKDQLEKVEGGIEKQYGQLKKRIKKFDLALRDVSTAIADDFRKYSQENYIEPADAGWVNESSLSADVAEVTKFIDDFQSLSKDVAQSLRRADRDTIVDTVLHYWPSGKRGWPSRAAVVTALDSAMGDIPIPEALKAPFLRGDVSDALQDNKIIRRLIESTNKKLSLNEVEDKVVLGFAQLAAAYQTVIGNPDTVSADDMAEGMDDLAAKIQEQATEVIELGHVMEGWHEAVSGFKPMGSSPKVESARDLDRAMKNLDSFFEKSDLIDPGPVVRELGDYVGENYDEIPEELRNVFSQYYQYEFEEDAAKKEEEDKAKKEEEEREDVLHKMGPGAGYHRASGAASYRTSSIGKMSRRLATFHGVDDRRGHPTNPTNTGYQSYDKRHFKEPHFKSILKAAGEILKDDWCKFGWDGGAEDAPVRAALDIAIGTADGALYQSKIDAETYDMLLNRLAKWGHDSFSDTVLPEKAKPEEKKRNASAMKNESYMNIVRVANDLRSTDPRAALNILKNLRSLVSTDADPGVAGIEMAPNVKAISNEMPPGMNGAPPAPDAGADDGEQTAGIMEGDIVDLGSMGEDDFEKLKHDLEQRAQKLFNEKDVDAFLDGWDDLMQEVEESMPDTMRSASSWARGVPLPILVRIAASSPEARRVLGPVLVAAKKKQDKKQAKKSKTSKKDKKDDSGNPFGDKKAPPFGKGKGKGKKKGKKRKAVTISQDDYNW